MKKLTMVPLFAALLLLAAVPQQARAQADIALGVRGSYEVDELQSFALGAGLRVSTIALPIVINPTFDYYFLGERDGGIFGGGGDVAFYQFTVNALFEFGLNNPVFTPYAGPGLSVSQFQVGDSDSDTNVGLNLVGGAAFGFGPVEPFVQGSFVIGDGYEPASVTAGLLFSLN